MKNLKNYTMALVAMVIATGSVTLMSFAKLDDPESGWYAISTTSSDPNDKDQQLIQFREGSNTPTGPNCNLTNSNTPCQVHLDLTNFDSEDPISEMTVEEAELAGAVIGNYAKRSN